MGKKKRIILLIVISIIVIIAGISLTFGVTKYNKKQNKNEPSITLEYKDKLSINLEDKLPRIEDYVITGKITGEITYQDENNEVVDLTILKVGNYKVLIDGKEVCILEIKDEVRPELKLKELIINENETYVVKDFVESCTDNSKEECVLSYKEEIMASQVQEGTYDIVIIAKDNSANTIEQSTKLIIKKKEVNKSNSNTDKKINTNTNSSKNDINTNKPTLSIETEQMQEENPQIEESIVYGTKIIKTTSTDGKIEYKYDYSSFNGTTTNMKNEASSLLKTNANIYNEVLTYTNNYRNEVGVIPLTLDNNLNLAATIRALEMAYADYFSHTRPNGSDCFTVLQELGINSYYTLGENIAYGNYYTYYSPQQVTQGWRNSKGHYANMIKSNFTKLGVGYYKLGTKTYYVQMFGN